SNVKDLPEFEAWFKSFDAKNYIGVLKCAMVGCLLTFIVQSSSATLGITIGLAQIGVIPFETAAALVMGENVGTTITAWLASFGATTNAKRAAYFHVIFNLLGVLWITAIFIKIYLPSLVWVVAQIGWLFNFEPDVTFKIASAHTGFNVINTLIFLPLAPSLARTCRDRRHGSPTSRDRCDRGTDSSWPRSCLATRALDVTGPARLVAERKRVQRVGKRLAHLALGFVDQDRTDPDAAAGDHAASTALKMIPAETRVVPGAQALPVCIGAAAFDLRADLEHRQHLEPRFVDADLAEQLEEALLAVVGGNLFADLGDRQHRIDPDCYEILHALEHADETPLPTDRVVACGIPTVQ
ncbi:MAG: Na/Pi cotransporter family protein, partial [Acidobacteria bacterium]|nr:Na/Pi cotransporter family protein [Acidobacteriota bacterium]